MPKFRVRFARTVYMEDIVEAEDEGSVEDPGLMVYPDGKQPPYVTDVMDDESVWEVEEVQEEP